ncbi:hypothetical protein BaRGS_00009677 [Batillaria attramentaria]|uniref:Uncharacterized protein n=1 Tax=Batillaria attramentaria TaxID=370345 RepID=A0ABD0LI20_9CAEN
MATSVEAESDTVDAVNADTHNTKIKEVWSPQYDNTPQQLQLMSRFKEVEERLDNIEKHIGLKDKDKEKELKKSRDEIASMRQTLETAMARLAQREQELLATRSQLQNLQNTTSDDHQKIQDLEVVEKVKLSQLVQDLQLKLQDREEQINNMEKAIGALQDDLGSTKEQLSSTQAKLEDTKVQLDKSVKSMESQMEQVLKRMNALSTAKPSDQQKEEPKVAARLSGASMELPPIRRSYPQPNSKMNFPPPRK